MHNYTYKCVSISPKWSLNRENWGKWSQWDLGVLYLQTNPCVCLGGKDMEVGLQLLQNECKWRTKLHRRRDNQRRLEGAFLYLVWRIDGS